jgi:hypothetical protein
MVPLLKFYFNEDVRASAAQALPEMLRSASLAAEKGLGPDQAYVRNMLGFLWEPLVEAIPKEPDMDILVNLLEAADDIMDIVDGPKMLTLDQLTALFAKFAGVLQEYEERRAERMQRMQSEDFDAEEQEQIEQEHESGGRGCRLGTRISAAVCGAEGSRGGLPPASAAVPSAPPTIPSCLWRACD